MFSNAVVQRGQVSVGDFVAVKPTDPSVPMYIGKVMYLYQSEAKKFSKDQRKAHIMWLT